MKLTFVLPGYSRKPVGGYRIVYEYANRLVERGHTVCLVHPLRLRHSSYKVSLFIFLKSTLSYIVRRVFRLNPRWFKFSDGVLFLIVPNTDEKFIPDSDVLFVTSWQLTEEILKYSEKVGIKGYLFQHYEVWDGPKSIIDETWKLPIKKIVVSKWLRGVGLQLGALDNDLVYIPNAIDFYEYKIMSPLETRDNAISMMFSNHEWKGSSDGLKALEIVKDKYPDLRAMLFGVGAKPKSLPDWIDYYKNPPLDVLVGSIYNKTSIFLCASHSEGFALPPAEAMACGCAVVTTDCGGVLDFAIDGITALVSPPRNPGVLAGNILKLLRDTELKVKLAKAGYENIQKFSWENTIDKLEAFLLSTVKSK